MQFYRVVHGQVHKHRLTDRVLLASRLEKLMQVTMKLHSIPNPSMAKMLHFMLPQLLQRIDLSSTFCNSCGNGSEETRYNK